jgi:hypothetical protein
MDQLTITKANEKRLSATAMKCMMGSTVYALLGHKKEHFVQHKKSPSHQIHDK